MLHLLTLQIFSSCQWCGWSQLLHLETKTNNTSECYFVRHTNMPHMEHSSLLKCDTMWSGTGVPMFHRFLLNNGTLPTHVSLYSNQHEHNKSQCAVRSLLHTFVLFQATIDCYIMTDNKYKQHPDMKLPTN